MLHAVIISCILVCIHVQTMLSLTTAHNVTHPLRMLFVDDLAIMTEQLQKQTDISYRTTPPPATDRESPLILGDTAC